MAIPLAAQWTTIGRIFAVIGIFLAPIAVVLPSPYGVYLLAIDVGFANVASFLGIQIHVNFEAKQTKEKAQIFKPLENGLKEGD